MSRCQSRCEAAAGDAHRDREAAPPSGRDMIYVTHDQIEAMTLGQAGSSCSTR